MNLLVLLAGVADPRRPLPAAIDAAALTAHRAACPLLSPFDEAALELALKLRDAEPATRIEALVGAASERDPLVRHVGGFRLDAVGGLSLAEHPAWNAGMLAARLAAWIGALATPPDFVLMGREFGDEDDGVLPALLAEALGRPLLSQALLLRASEGSVEVLRQHGGGLERLRQRGPAVVAATNHTGNRLRHPLLKNVMAAKKAAYALTALPQAGADRPHVLSCTSVKAAQAPAREGACSMLVGSVDEQAAALARELMAVAA